jgi:hypothetical protein
MQLPAVVQGRNIAIHNPTATDSIRKPKPEAIRASRYATANDLDQVRCRSRQSTARGVLPRAGGVQEN